MHSLSVFQAETGLKDNNIIITENAILDALYLNNNETHTGSALDIIFDSINSRARKSFMSIAIQTDSSAANIRQSLENQVQEIRRSYMAKKATESDHPSHTIEERMLLFEKECEMRLKREFDTQLNQMRDVDIARVRLEETQKARWEFDRLRKDLESEYQRRMETHVQREEQSAKSAAEREKHMQQTQYECMQKEIDELRNREQSLARKYELESQGLSLLELRIKESISLLESREREIYRRERETDLMIKEYQERARVEARMHLQSELDAVLKERALVRMEKQRVDEAQAAHIQRIDELTLSRNECGMQAKVIGSLATEMDKVRGQLAHTEAALHQQKVFMEQAVLREQQAMGSVEAVAGPLRKELEDTKVALMDLKVISEQADKAYRKQIGTPIQYWYYITCVIYLP